MDGYIRYKGALKLLFDELEDELDEVLFEFEGEVNAVDVVEMAGTILFEFRDVYEVDPVLVRLENVLLRHGFPSTTKIVCGEKVVYL